MASDDDADEASGRAPGPDVAAADESGEVGEDRPGRSSWKRAPFWLAILLAVLVVAWLAAVAMTARAAEQDLQVARDQLFAAERQLRDAEFLEARDAMTQATAAADRAAERLARAYMRPVRSLPLAGPNLQGAQTLADAVGSVSEASVGVLDIVVDELEAGSAGDGGGGLPLARLEELAAPTRRLAASFEDSMAAVEALDPDRLVERVVEARQRFLDVAASNVDAVALTAEVLEVMPGLLGADGPRVYLVGAGALSELRGSGGLLGSWTILTVDDGELSFDDFVDVDELPVPDAPVASPSDDFERRYGRFSALSTWRNANISPDFPAAAQVLMRLYEAGGGPPVDGVIVADTVVFQRLAERSGGLEVQGVGFLGPQETLEFVGLDAYAEFDDEAERKLVLGAAATAAFTELFDALDGDDVRATSQMFSSVAQGGHLHVHVRDDEAQQVLERVGVAGSLPVTDGESFGLFASNFAQNKVDFFTDMEIEHHVRLAADGVTYGTVVGRMQNGAPDDGYPRGVLGPWLDDVEPGDNVSFVTASCSRSCDFLTIPDAAVDGGTERGRSMADALIHLRAGASGSLRYETRSAQGWQDVGGSALLTVQHLVQPRVRPTELKVRVDVPAGFEAVELPDGATSDADEVVWEDLVSGTVDLTFRFVPIPDDM